MRRNSYEESVMGHRAKHRRENWIAERVEAARIREVKETQRQAEDAERRRLREEQMA